MSTHIFGYELRAAVVVDDEYVDISDLFEIRDRRNPSDPVPDSFSLNPERVLTRIDQARCDHIGHGGTIIAKEALNLQTGERLVIERVGSNESYFGVAGNLSVRKYDRGY